MMVLAAMLTLSAKAYDFSIIVLAQSTIKNPTNTCTPQNPTNCPVWTTGKIFTNHFVSATQAGYFGCGQIRLIAPAGFNAESVSVTVYQGNSPNAVTNPVFTNMGIMSMTSFVTNWYRAEMQIKAH